MCDPSAYLPVGIIRVIALIVALPQPSRSIIRLRIRTLSSINNLRSQICSTSRNREHFSLFPNKIAITPKTQLKNINLCFFQVCSGLDFNSHLKLNWGVNPYRWFKAFGVKTTPPSPGSMLSATSSQVKSSHDVTKQAAVTNLRVFHTFTNLSQAHVQGNHYQASWNRSLVRWRMIYSLRLAVETTARYLGATICLVFITR